MLRAERQSALMSKITNEVLTQSDGGCFIAVVLIWQHSVHQRVKFSSAKQSLKQTFSDVPDAPSMLGGLLTSRHRHRNTKA